LNRKDLLIPFAKLAVSHLDWKDALQMAMATIEAEG
jgi:hypothetical protein